MNAHLESVEKLPELQRYSFAQLDDFKDEFSRLPPDVHPLDPQLADPRILHRRPENMRRINHNGRAPRGRQMQQEQWVFPEDAQRGLPSGYRIDLNLPLLNIFLLSFLPWFRVEV